MKTKYYKLRPDEGFWCIGEKAIGEVVDKRFGQQYGYNVHRFKESKRVKCDPPVAPFEIIAAGIVADVNLTLFSAPVVSEKVVDLLGEEFSDSNIQLFPSSVDGHSGNWCVLNALDGFDMDCVDHEKSRIQYHRADHPRTPGELHYIEKLIVLPDKVQGSDFFRINEWSVVLLVSERVKNAFDKAGVRGLDYLPIT